MILKLYQKKKKSLKNLSSKDNKSSTAILSGKIINKNGQEVISYGEIVKTSTLRILADKFKMTKPLTLLKISKKKNLEIKHINLFK